MVDTERDRALGMDRAITRRDFLNGVAVTIGGAAVAHAGLFPAAAFGKTPATDPATLTGLRGHSEQAMGVAHALRDGTFWDSAPAPQATGEHYDLVVVGGGISGLAAAHLWRQQRPEARVLILENNDEFGGHARRNTFTASNGRELIGYGGSQSLQTPSFFSPVVHQLLSDVGIDLAQFEAWYDSEWHERHGLGDAIFFHRETWGEDKLVVTGDVAAEWVPQTPLNETAKANLIELIDSPPDYLAGKSREEKFEILRQTTYRDFLTEICGYDPQLVTFFQDSTEDYFGAGIEAVTALDAWGNWNPGFDGMDLGDVPYRTMSPSGRLVLVDPDDYIYHFPDGNAGVARALVRALIPAALPGSSMEEIVTAQIDHAAMDRPDNPVNLRLEASVVKVAHDGEPDSAETVTVTYFEDGALKTVTGGNVVLACWHRVIPYLTSELSDEQVAALNDQVKIPLIYTNVQLRNWEALDALKIAGFQAPSGFWRGVEIDFPVSVGDYRFPEEPSEPIVLHLAKMPLPRDPALSAREQASAGRQMLTTITFEDFEREIRDMLQRALGPAGFDAARDIEGITVNRWSHGYALEYMRPWDTYWPDGPLPIETARRPWGRIAIANSDSGAYAYAHSAIDQAARAVSELLGEEAEMPAYSEFPGPPPELVGLED